MKADNYSKKTHSKNIDRFLLLSRNKEFRNEIEKTQQSWGLPMKDWEQLSEHPDSLYQIMGLFLSKHLPRLILRMEAFSSPDVDRFRIFTLFGLVCEYMIKHPPTERAKTSQHDEFVKEIIDVKADPAFSMAQLLCLADSPPAASPLAGNLPPELKDKMLNAVKDDPNQSKTLAKLEELSTYVGLAETLFLKDMSGLLTQRSLGTEWRQTILAYLFTASEEFALQHVPPINVDARNYETGSLIRTGLHTKVRDLEAVYSSIKPENRASARHNYPTKNLKRDLSNLDKKKTFKANRKDYDGNPSTNCFDNPTNWGDVGAAHFTRVIKKGKKFSLLRNRKKIDPLGESLKRGAFRAEKKIKESYNPPNTP